MSKTNKTPLLGWLLVTMILSSGLGGNIITFFVVGAALVPAMWILNKHTQSK